MIGLGSYAKSCMCRERNTRVARTEKRSSGTVSVFTPCSHQPGGVTTSISTSGNVRAIARSRPRKAGVKLACAIRRTLSRFSSASVSDDAAETSYSGVICRWIGVLYGEYRLRSVPSQTRPYVFARLMTVLAKCRKPHQPKLRWRRPQQAREYETQIHRGQISRPVFATYAGPRPYSRIWSSLQLDS